jgi:hypothetical protein
VRAGLRQRGGRCGRWSSEDANEKIEHGPSSREAWRPPIDRPRPHLKSSRRKPSRGATTALTRRRQRRRRRRSHERQEILSAEKHSSTSITEYHRATEAFESTTSYAAYSEKMTKRKLTALDKVDADTAALRYKLLETFITS